MAHSFTYIDCPFNCLPEEIHGEAIESKFKYSTEIYRMDLKNGVIYQVLNPIGFGATDI